MIKSNGDFLEITRIKGLDEGINKFLQDNIYIDSLRDKELINASDVFKKINIISKYETMKKEVSPKTYDYMSKIIIDREGLTLQ